MQSNEVNSQTAITRNKHGTKYRAVVTLRGHTDGADILGIYVIDGNIGQLKIDPEQGDIICIKLSRTKGYVFSPIKIINASDGTELNTPISCSINDSLGCEYIQYNFKMPESDVDVIIDVTDFRVQKEDIEMKEGFHEVRIQKCNGIKDCKVLNPGDVDRFDTAYCYKGTTVHIQAHILEGVKIDEDHISIKSYIKDHSISVTDLKLKVNGDIADITFTMPDDAVIVSITPQYIVDPPNDKIDRYQVYNHVGPHGMIKFNNDPDIFKSDNTSAQISKINYKMANCGKSIELEVVPDDDYQIKEFKICERDTGKRIMHYPDEPYTKRLIKTRFIMPDTDIALMVDFEEIQNAPKEISGKHNKKCTLFSRITPNGVVMFDDQITFRNSEDYTECDTNYKICNSLEEVSLRIIPDDGYRVDDNVTLWNSEGVFLRKLNTTQDPERPDIIVSSFLMPCVDITLRVDFVKDDTQMDGITDYFEIPDELARELSELLTKQTIRERMLVQLLDDPIKYEKAESMLIPVTSRIEAIKVKITKQYVPSKYNSTDYMWNYDGYEIDKNKVQIIKVG